MQTQKNTSVDQVLTQVTDAPERGKKNNSNTSKHFDISQGKRLIMELLANQRALYKSMEEMNVDFKPQFTAYNQLSFITEVILDDYEKGVFEVG